MRKLYIIRARRCKEGCWQYTRQDLEGFVDEEDIRALPIPPRIIERNYNRSLEGDEFFYTHDDVPEEANALLFDKRLEKETSMIYAASYCHLKRVEDFCCLKNGEPCGMERTEKQ